MSDGTITIVQDEPTTHSTLTAKPEYRMFNLNEARALRKKLKATERKSVIVSETGGGLKLELSAGMYELLKSSAESFYSSDKLQFKCQRIPVLDKQGNLVETKAIH